MRSELDASSLVLAKHHGFGAGTWLILLAVLMAPAGLHAQNALTVEADRIATASDLASGGKLQLGDLTPGSATCIAVDSDRVYADLDCDGVKEAGEEYLDGAGGGGGGSGSGRVLISQVVASADAAVAFTSGIDDTYDVYELEALGVTVSVDNVEVDLTVSDDGGSSYETSGYSGSVWGHGPSASGNTSASTSALRLTGASSGWGIDNTDAASSRSFLIRFVQPASTSIHCEFLWDSWGTFGNEDHGRQHGAGAWTGGTGAIDAVRIAPASGTFSGTFRLWGVPKS